MINRKWSLYIGSGGHLVIHDHTAGRNRIVVDTNGDMGMGEDIPHGQVHVKQGSASGDAQPVLYLNQADVDVEFISLEGAAAAGVPTQSLVKYGDEAGYTPAVWLKISVLDHGGQVVSQPYYVLAYSLT